MRLYILLICLVLGVCMGPTAGRAQTAPSDWPAAGHDAQASNFNLAETALSRASIGRLRPAWSVTFPVESAVVANNRLYALRSGPNPAVVVVDPRSGKVLETFGLASLKLPADTALRDLAYAAGRLIVAAVTTVLALNPVSGRVIWRTVGGGQQIAVDGSTIFTAKDCTAVCGDQASYALDMAGGKVLWRHPGNGGGRPALIAKRLFQVWSGGGTRVYDPRSGNLVASLPFQAHWIGDAASYYAYRVDTSGFGATHSRLEQIDATGRPRWKLDLGKADSPPALAYRTLFAPSYRFHPGLVAVNATTGKLRWAANVGLVGSLAVANHLVYVLSGGHRSLSVLDADSGKQVRRLTVPGFEHFTASLLLANGRVFIAGGGGILALQT